jgi:hypothetical protein
LRYNRSRFYKFLFFLQKLSGKSIGKFYQSCSVFHQESNKIGFAIFRFFYDFLWIFLSLSKSPLLLKIWFYTETPKSFQKLTSIPLVHRKAPGKKKRKAIGSLAMGRWRLRPIPGEPAAGSVGEIVGGGGACGLTLSRFVTGVGAERPPASTGGDAETTHPPRPKCRRGTGQGAAWRGLGTCGGARRGLRRALRAVDASGRGLGVCCSIGGSNGGRHGMAAREEGAAV